MKGSSVQEAEKCGRRCVRFLKLFPAYRRLRNMEKFISWQTPVSHRKQASSFCQDDTSESASQCPPNVWETTSFPPAAAETSAAYSLEMYVIPSGVFRLFIPSGRRRDSSLEIGQRQDSSPFFCFLRRIPASSSQDTLLHLRS